MMKLRQGLFLGIALASVHLSACSYIQSWFPDKEKDYQYTTEIPPLKVPHELTDKPVFKSSDAAPEEAPHEETADASQETESPGSDEEAGTGVDQPDVSGMTPDEAAPAETKTQRIEPDESESQAEMEPSAEPVPSDGPAPTDQSVQEEGDEPAKLTADLVVYDDGETRLRINRDKANAWRVVGKALSRRSIEVVDRDQEESSYDVRYDPEEQPYKDESWWDEIKFVFGGIKSRDNQYVLKLIENNRQTDVAILDQDGEPTADPAGFSLLKLIQKTIHADQAK